MDLPRILSEDVIDMAAAAKLLHEDVSTVRRWVQKGTEVRGRTVKLEGLRVGYFWNTSWQAVLRFQAAPQQTEEPTDTSPPPAQQPPQAVPELDAEQERLRQLAMDAARRFG
jgi:hypothetical protein